MNLEEVLALLLAFVACVLVNVVFHVKGMKMPYTSEQLSDFLSNLARMAVEATEQLCKNSNEHGNDKFEIANNLLDSLLTDAGIDDSFSQASKTAAIEQGVYNKNLMDEVRLRYQEEEVTEQTDTSEGEPDEIEEVED